MQSTQFKREAIHRLPGILAEFFGEPASTPTFAPEGVDRTIDFIIDAGGRRWAIKAKASSSPGTVAVAADELAEVRSPDAIPLLTVPYMTPAGAKTASERHLNWVDLAGNASLNDVELYVRVQGRANQLGASGRPASPFAPKSSRVARALLLDPERWWVQKELAEHTALDAGRISRVVRRLEDDDLLARDGSRLRPRDPGLLLDAWTDGYRFDRHDIVTGHLTGSGVELARELHQQLDKSGIDHAFTGLPAAWVLDQFARFRLVSVYVAGDPRAVGDATELRLNDRGANVQLIGPNDPGVFDGRHEVDELPCVTPVQVYLDLGHLPERAHEAAEQLRSAGSLWHATR